MRVFIVDDSPAMRGFVRRVFTMAGFDDAVFDEAGDGQEAIEKLRQQPADLILTDVHMPRMSGEEMLEALRGDEALASIPVLVISTDATHERLDHMLALGAKGYLKKPFYPEALSAELERVIGVSDAG